MNKLLCALVLVSLPLSGASAQSMNAEVFLKRAVALKKKGPMALFSRGEIRALMAEGKAAGVKAREHRLAAVKAGQTPPYCPPEGTHAIGTDEFMTRLSAIPAAERARMNMTQAMVRIFATKFPCKR